MRAADSDREAVAERLRSALNDGRLDLHEYDERVRQTYAAKTYADLKALVSDLPETIPAGQAQMVPAERAQPSELVPQSDGQYPHATRRWLVDNWSPYIGTVAITTGVWGAICVMAGELIYFWPGWVAGPWGVVLAVTTVGGLVSGKPQEWAAKQARRKRAELEKLEKDADVR